MLGVFSNGQLATCHPKLQRVIREADRLLSKRGILDLTVLCGHRGQKDQEQAVRDGASTKHWPDSRHNELPSSAVDVTPYPVDWKDTTRQARLAGYILAVADSLDIELEWGDDWNDNGRSRDETFHDMPHLQLSKRELARP